MRGRNKKRERSVASQSTEVHDSEADISSARTRLCKKTGFRDLILKAVTVEAQENERKHETASLPGDRISRSVQTTPSDRDPMFHRFPQGFSHSVEFPNFRGNNFRQPFKAADRKLASKRSNPGTSRMTPTTLTSQVHVTQLNEIHNRRQDGSLSVVFNYDDKSLPQSRTSNVLYYGSQGSRRFSDETVLLIEDYHSYDTTNVAGRLEINSSQRKILTCCGRKKRYSTDSYVRSLPVSFDYADGGEDFLICRICHEGERYEPLLQPCLCKGSVGCVHASCLKVWLEQSNTSRCELCNYPYAIKQTRKYSKCVSVRVFFGTVISKKSLVYDAISFVVITPLTIVGVVMCIQASVFSMNGELGDDSNLQMGNITKVGMIMLSVTILVAYCVWLYTLISFHYRAWRKWYNNCFDVEVVPVRMTSQEKIEAAQKLHEELNRQQLSREFGSSPVAVLPVHNSANYSYNPTRQVSASEN
ncbi:hypothetical protein RUM43_005301 [Polyplax serrata]|uniref:RING-CH-type domain-containing protein n=1 Tax=Polyplax serrata TaxID=468196 RepID=A0AAN8PB23_POLSC